MDKKYTGVRPHQGGIEIRWQVNGRRYSEFIAKTPNPSNLRTAAKIRKQRIEQGRCGSDLSTATFFDVAQSYLNALDIEYSTADSYRGMLQRYWLPALGHRPIDQIKFSELRDLLASLPVSGKTKQNALQPLRGVFALAVADGLPDNPAARLAAPKHQRGDIDPVTPDEWAEISQKLNGQALDYFSLIWATGMRHPGEVIALDWADVDLDTGTLRIDKSVVRSRLKETTKTGVARTLILTEEALEILRRLPTRFAGGPLFINSEGGRYTDGKAMNRLWHKALKAAGVRHRKAYALRHGFASVALTGGMEPGFIADYLGHSLDMLYRHYGKYIRSDSDREKAARMHMIRQAIFKSGEKAGIKSRK